MLPTFVIGLREGLEAALIVAIIAAFLRQRGRSDAVRSLWIGVALAAAICAVVAVGLQLYSSTLPQQQQEMLETVVTVVAIATVTSMVVWMRRNSRGLKAHLESSTSAALAAGTTTALVLTAFLAVLREGFETATFMLAAFDSSESPLAAGFGALLGVAVAVGLGYGIYRGGVRINMSRFFRATGFVLVLVAAGLVATAFHTAHEAGWINFGQATVLDLSGIMRPGSLQSALLTGTLGLQVRPTAIETIGWLSYLSVMTIVVLWPQRRRQSTPPRPTSPAQGELVRPSEVTGS